MMESAKNVILAIVLVCAASYVGYVVGGNQRQKIVEQKIELLNYAEWAAEVNANVKLLDLIEAKKYKDAEDLLEKFLDVRLASLSPYDKLANQHPDEDIFNAIDIAKKHREQHASHKVAPELEASVSRALKIQMKGGL